MKFHFLMLSILLSISCLSVKSQDTIVMNNGKRVVSIVNEISDTEIRFKEFTSPDGPVYVIKKASVDRIIFDDGQQKVFRLEKRFISYGRNVINYHLFDIVYQDFNISYENILKNGMVGFKVPLSIGFNNDNVESGPYEFKNLMYSGVGVNIYPMGQRIASYFMGPELNIGLGKDYIYDYYNYYYEENETEFFYGRLLINNGVAFTPVSNLRLSTVLGIGIRYYEASSENDGVRSTAYFTFTMGYRF